MPQLRLDAHQMTSVLTQRHAQTETVEILAIPAIHAAPPLFVQQQGTRQHALVPLALRETHIKDVLQVNI